MTEAHTMTVRWAGDEVLANALVAAAREQGHEALVAEDERGVSLTVEVTDSDLQNLRDRVDALLVAFSALEEQHTG